MKAITLYQPWASLVALGAKVFETRSWYTMYRGPLAIHAGKNTDPLEELAAYYQRERETRVPLETPVCPSSGGIALAYHFREVIRSHYDGAFKLGDLPRGTIVAVAELVEVLHTDWVIEHVPLSRQEIAFGNFGEGRYAWRLESVRMLPRPIQARGYQMLWDVDPALETAIAAQLT